MNLTIEDLNSTGVIIWPSLIIWSAVLVFCRQNGTLLHFGSAAIACLIAELWALDWNFDRFCFCHVARSVNIAGLFALIMVKVNQLTGRRPY